MKYFILLFCTLTLFSCTTEPNAENLNVANNFFTVLFSDRKLESQVFELNNSEPSTLLTKRGNVIEIPAEAFSGGSKIIKINVQEAFDMEEIYFANMQTSADNHPLQSSGMMNITSTDKSVKLVKKLKVHILQKNYNARMNFYKGEEDSMGVVNWVNPIPLLPEEDLSMFDKGEQLFQANCISCHNVFKSGTGPTLVGIGNRRPKEWLYKFIRNPAAVIASGDPYANCVYELWNKTAMTAFQLSDKQIDDIIFYLDEKGKERPALMNDLATPTSCDSCELYTNAIRKIDEETTNALLAVYKKRDADRKKVYENIVYPNGPRTIAQNEVANQGIFTQDEVYTIELGELGWLNIDVLLKDIFQKHVFNLAFTLDKKMEETQINLLVPEFLCNTAASKKEDNSFYFPYDLNIPAKSKCFLITIGKEQDKFFIDIQSFNAKEKQQFNISPVEIDKGSIANKIKSLNLNQYELNKNATESMRSFKEGNASFNKIKTEVENRRTKIFELSNRKKTDALQLKPKGCNCCYYADSVHILKELLLDDTATDYQ